MSVEFVGIELDLRGEEAVYADLQKIDNLLKSLGGKKKVDAGMDDLRRQMVAARGELEKYKRLQRETFEKTGIKGAYADEIQQATYRVRDLQQAMNEIRTASRSAGETFKQAFNQASTSMTHMGQKLQTLGNTMQKIGSPFERFTTGMVMGAGYKALSKFTEGLSSGFERYDTMKKYPKMMAAFGYSAEESQKSIDALDKSVRGLPTGLDEMVNLTQRFTATTGDLEKGTKLAIATNNAFLASMSTDTQRYQGMMQLQDVLGGKDMNAREWNSLVSSMNPAIVKMGESLGYTKKNMSEFIQTVRDGKMDNQEFIDQLIKIGNEGGVLEKMAQQSKDTWQAFFANVGNASSRMMAGVIQAFDEISRQMTGKDVNQFLAENFIPSIDKATESVKGWIKAHPEEIKRFFKDLSSIDVKGFAKGMADGMLTMAKGVQTLARIAKGVSLEKWGKWLTLMGPLGRAITIFGGGLKGLSTPLAGLYAVIRTIQRSRGKGLLEMFDGMLLGRRGKDLGEATKELGKAAPQMGKLGTALSKVFRGWGQIATMIGGSAFVAWGSMKLFKGAMKSFGEMVDIIDGINWRTGAKALGGITVFLSAMAGLGKLAGKHIGGSIEVLIGETVVGLMTTIAAGFADLDMYLLKRSFKNFSDGIKYLNQGVKGLGQIKDIDGSVADKVENAIGVFNRITTMFKGSVNADTKQVEGGFKGFEKADTNSLKNLSAALTSMLKSIDSLNELNKSKVNIDNIGNVMSQVETALFHVGRVFDFMPPSLKSGEAAKTSLTMATTLTNVKNAFKSLTAGDGILTQLPMISSAVQNINLDVIKTQFTKLGQMITAVYTSLQGIGNGQYFASNIDSFRAGIKSLKFAIKHLQEVSQMDVSNGMVGKIRGIVNKIKSAFSAKAISAIQEQVNTFAQSIKTALNALKSINEDIEVKATVKLSSSFQTSVSKVIKTINDAKDKIKKTKSAVRFTIPVSVTFSVSSNLFSALSTIANQKAQLRAAASGGGAVTTGNGASRATGGMIYRAKGGSIGFPGRPRGVDRVPVWAQAGEFMQSKRAVDTFGINFMRKVNDLDIKGAMRELMTRAGGMANVSRGTVVNNTYNNNQRVEINANNPSPDFAFRSASRFAGAFR